MVYILLGVKQKVIHGITVNKGYYWGDYLYTKDTCTGTTDTTFRGGLTKYNTNSASGTVDNLTTLELADDAAYTEDKICSMPTSGECEELINNTTSAWTIVNNITGVKLTSVNNNNSMFIPAYGYVKNNNINNIGTYGYLWTSTLNQKFPNYAYYLAFYSDNIGIGYNERCSGRTIRAVKK